METVTRPTKSKFEIMYDAIDAHSAAKVQDIINTLFAKQTLTSDEQFILWVAGAVITGKAGA